MLPSHQSTSRLSILSLASLLDDQEEPGQYANYDEDLSQNPFFKSLQVQKDHKLYSAAMENLWTICVPCGPSLGDVKITPDFLRTHLLSSVAGAEVIASYPLNWSSLSVGEWPGLGAGSASSSSSSSSSSSCSPVCCCWFRLMWLSPLSFIASALRHAILFQRMVLRNIFGFHHLCKVIFQGMTPDI